MENIARPRSFVKTAAVAAITLLSAGCLTVLGLGIEGCLWQIKLANAELNKAQAQMEQAKALFAQAMAALEQAKSVVAAATVTGKASVDSAHITAQGNVKSADITATGAVKSAELGNYAEVISTNALKPAIWEPVEQHTALSRKAAILEDELSRGLDHATQQTLTSEQLAAKGQELHAINRELEIVRAGITRNMAGGVEAFAGGLTEGIKSLFGGRTAKHDEINPNPFPTRPAGAGPRPIPPSAAKITIPQPPELNVAYDER